MVLISTDGQAVDNIKLHLGVRRAVMMQMMTVTKDLDDMLLRYRCYLVEDALGRCIQLLMLTRFLLDATESMS